ncbi:MAG: hypothetical protein A3C79_01595 [Candidatus Taylorbacteria bacterium RIFCSPHIGHO2_02_FULL_45_28]|nr:MAG: hypothetical protein A3C79_01595 [Candidatus Taylorbacteria bacterium RIFCSPHIGHO2_02_FULL_45_28]OHA33127.1 MAG: hypothetical protein A3A23_03655 [Candidatus Taylorbacteria bacterium RIFCSPLOWO2_01_FULL_45_59]
MKRSVLSKSERDEKARIKQMVQEIQSAANYSLALLGWGFIRHGSGRFLNIRPAPRFFRGR